MFARSIPLLLLATGGAAFAQGTVGVAPVGPVKVPDRPIGPGDVIARKVPAPGETVTLTLTTTGPGKLTVNKVFCIPKGSGATRTCTRAVLKGGDVRIAPVPDGGALLVRWSGSCDVGHAIDTCTLHPSADFAAGAEFRMPEEHPKLMLEYNVAVSKPADAPDRIQWTLDPPMPVGCAKVVNQAVGRTWYWVDVTCTASPPAGSTVTVSGMWRTAAGDAMYPVTVWTRDCNAHKGPTTTCTLDMRLSRTGGTYGMSPDQK